MTVDLLRSSTALFFALGAVSIFAFAATPAEAATRTWDGGGATNNWNEAANWSSNLTPGTGDVATFDGTSTKNATINVSIDVSGIDINSGYTGTITQASGSTVTVGTGDFDISAGAFVGSDAQISTEDGFTISGGTFTSTSGVLGVQNWTITSGAFNHNNGTVQIGDSGSRTWNFAPSVTVYNLIIARTADYTLTLSDGDTLNVDNDVSLLDGIFDSGGFANNAKLLIKGDLTGDAAFDGGDVILDFADDAVAQTFTFNGGSTPRVRLDDADDANDSVIYTDETFVEEFIVTSGFSGNIPITNTADDLLTFEGWQQLAGSYDASAQSTWEFGSFVRTGGSFVAPNLVRAVLATTGSWDVASSQTFVNLEVDRSTGFQVTLGANDLFVVTDDLTLTDGMIDNGSVDVYGDISMGPDFDGGDSIIDFADDAVAQTFTITADASGILGGEGPIVRLDDPDDANDLIDFYANATLEGLITNSAFSGVIPIANTLDRFIKFNAWDQDGGTYDASAQGTWGFESFINRVNGSFVAPALVMATGSSGAWDVDGSQIFQSFNVDKTHNNAVQMGSGDIFIINGGFSIENGKIDTGRLEVYGDILQEQLSDGGSAVLEFSNDAVAQVYTILGDIGPGIEFDDPDDASDLIEIDDDATLTLLSVTSGFSGNIPIVNLLDYELTFTEWRQQAGTYDASADSSWVIKTFTQTGGTFVAPALVTANSGTATWDVNGAQTFNNFTVSKTSNTPLTLGSGDSLVINGDLTLTDGKIDVGTYQVHGDITQASTFDGGTTSISFADDATAQVYTINGGTTPGILLDDADDANDDVDLVANTTITSFVTTSGFSGNVPLNNPSNFALTFTSLNIGGGTWNASAQSAWNIVALTTSGGTFTAPALVTVSGSSGTFDVNGSQAFDALTINRTSSLTIASGDTLIVNGVLTLTNGSANTGSLEARGNVTVQSTWDGGSSTLLFAGSATQSFNLTGATALYNGDIKTNKSGGQVALSSALVMDASGQDLVIEEGTFHLNGQNLTVNGSTGTIVVENGGTFSLRGSETITKNAGQPTTQAGSTVRYTGDGDSAADSFTLTTLTANYGGNLLIDSSDGTTDTYTLGAALDVNGDLISSGTLDVTTSNRAITLAGNWTNTGAFNGRNGTVTLDGGSQSLSGSTTFYNLTKSVSSAATLTFTTGSTYTMSNTTTLKGVSGQLLSLRSSSGGSAVSINPQGTDVLEYLNVQDSNNINGSAAVCLTGTCVDSGNNTNWTF